MSHILSHYFSIVFSFLSQLSFIVKYVFTRWAKRTLPGTTPVKPWLNLTGKNKVNTQVNNKAPIDNLDWLVKTVTPMIPMLYHFWSAKKESLRLIVIPITEKRKLFVMSLDFNQYFIISIKVFSNSVWTNYPM